MKTLLVLGAGTAGTIVANKLRPLLSDDEWNIAIVDQELEHHYQPGYLFIPFGTYTPEQAIKPKKKFMPQGVGLTLGEIDRVEPEMNRVHLTNGSIITYDYLVIATGATPRPDQTPGMDGEEWRRSVFDFYTYEGATALADRLASWNGGRLVVHIRWVTSSSLPWATRQLTCRRCSWDCRE